jgi:exopolyphosphatase/guanosine-5'-triphosphate,3'-diphosphate pyrophosphatase
VGIGGSARALAKGIMEATAYPLDKLHAFAYRYRDHRDYIDAIIELDLDDLGDYAIKPERFDTIREGALILDAVVRRCGIRRIVTSGVGVREGVYLASRLRRDGMRFPAGINPSIRSIRDRFDIVTLPAGHRRRHGRQLFDLLQKRFGGDRHDRDLLMHALSLANTGKMLTIYKEHRHAHCIAEQELNYGFWHEEIVTIALLLRSKGMRTYHKELYRHYRALLPRKKKLKWMVFIYTLTLILYENGVESRIDFGCHKGELSLIFQSAVSYLLFEALQRISVPKGLTIRIEQA